VVIVVKQILQAFGIVIFPKDFCNRCTTCNCGEWQAVTKEEVKEDV
jgi:hypothetical protein